MRILHVSTPASWRGGEQQLAYLFEEMRRKGAEQFIACRLGSEMHLYCKQEGANHFAWKKRGGVDPSFAMNIKKVCQQHQIQLIHVHDSHAHTFAVMAALFGNTTPIVVSRRVDFPVSKSFLSKWKYNHPSIVKIVCVSDAIKEITGRDIRNKSLLTTVHSGVDLSRFENKQIEGRLRKEYNIDAATWLVGNVAALAPHKDYFTFIDAVEILVKSGLNARYFIIGKGHLREELEAYIRSKQLGAHIIFTGFRTDIPEVLPELDVFLITSETEGLGTSIIDAFASKVPVVATNAGGIPELVVPRKTGLLSEVRDAASLAQQVTELLNDAALRQSLVEGAWQKALTFSREATAEKTAQIYRELLR